MTPSSCDFCYRPAVTPVRRARRALLDVLLGRPAPVAYVCEGHLGKGLDHVRSWRVGLAVADLRARSGLVALAAGKYIAAGLALLAGSALDAFRRVRRAR